MNGPHISSPKTRAKRYLECFWSNAPARCGSIWLDRPVDAAFSRALVRTNHEARACGSASPTAARARLQRAGSHACSRLSHIQIGVMLAQECEGQRSMAASHVGLPRRGTVAAEVHALA